MKNIILINLLLLCGVWAEPTSNPLVKTKKGSIRGLLATDGDYAKFLGIPYARVNASNPFGASLPYPNFEKVFEANDDSISCPQIAENEGKLIGTLDCLRLNVFVPKQASTKNNLPVLVWIHGGGFQFGSMSTSKFGPKYLVRHDVVLVTLNYRLGPYGFMCLDTPEVPGNQGLKDQLSALRWVKENINSFGGDSNKITLFGESAGGVSVDYHLLSKQEKLFDKVIMQSGTSLRPKAVVDSDISAPIALAELSGLETVDLDEAINYLAELDPKLVVAAGSELPQTFMPCVEKKFDNVETFIGSHPINTAIPKAKNVLILSGYNNQESLVSYYKKTVDDLTLDVFRENLAIIFDLSKNDLKTIVRQFYVGDEEVSEDIKWDLINFESDFTFGHPVHRSLYKYLENNGKVYHYIFSYAGGRNFEKYKSNITIGGASHGDELGYLFGADIFKESPSEKDQLVIDRMTTMWTNFAKYGDPTPEISNLLPVKWTPISKETLTYLDINEELTLGRQPFHDRMAFLDLFFDKNKRLLKGYKGNGN